MLEFESITNRYYAHFLGIEKINFNNEIKSYFNSKLDTKFIGYSYPIDIILFLKENSINISYGNKAKSIIPKLLNSLNCNMDIDNIKNILENVFHFKLKHKTKFVYKNKMEIENTAIILTEEHLELFIYFFRENNPNCKDYTWINEYFYKLVDKHYCHGIIVDGILVCATDAPDIPFMNTLVQEIGINTLKEHRRKGYAKIVCNSLIETLISKNICPIWSIGKENVGSNKLSKSVGFEEYCEVMEICI